jgi:hypothetical protein
VQTHSSRGEAMTEAQERDLEDLLARSKTDEQLISDPKFWELYFFAFCDPEKVKDFCQYCSIPEDYIQTKRREFLRGYIREHAPYWHRNPGTIH